MDIDSLLMHADEEILQSIIGASTVRLLDLLDPGLASPTQLRNLVMQSTDRAELLERPYLRIPLLDLLPPAEATNLAILLDLDPSEPYASLRSMHVSRGTARHKALFEILGVEQPSGNVDSPSPGVEETQPEFGLFSHQRRAIREAIHILDSEQRRVLLHMPTGSGKTRAAMHIVANLLRREEPTTVVWLAYSDELCGQAADEFLRAWTHLGDRQVSLYRHWGSNTTDLECVTDGVVIAGLSKMYAGARTAIQPLLTLADRSSMVVIDEAHQAVAETYRFLLEVLVERDPNSRLLGLSATPGRTWNDPEKDRALSDFFYRQKVTLKVDGYDNPVDYLIEQGYLARPDFKAMPYSSRTELTAKDLADLESGLDIPERIVRQLAEDDQRNLVIVNEVEALARRHRRILLFAATVEHAVMLASVLAARGLNATAITSKTEQNTRRRLIGEFKSELEAPMVLCNFGVLTAGFDAPATSAALIARPTKSLVLYSQMVGRATRGTLAGGNSDSEIVTIVDTALPGFGDMGQAFTNWEDVW